MTMRELAFLFRKFACVLQEEVAWLHGGVERLGEEDSHLRVLRCRGRSLKGVT